MQTYRKGRPPIYLTIYKHIHFLIRSLWTEPRGREKGRLIIVSNFKVHTVIQDAALHACPSLLILSARSWSAFSLFLFIVLLLFHFIFYSFLVEI